MLCMHEFYMASLADPVFKEAFAISFTQSYLDVYKDFLGGTRNEVDSILSFGVQFLNRASFVRLLVEQYHLLDILVDAFIYSIASGCR